MCRSHVPHTMQGVDQSVSVAIGPGKHAACKRQVLSHEMWTAQAPEMGGNKHNRREVHNQLSNQPEAALKSENILMLLQYLARSLHQPRNNSKTMMSNVHTCVLHHRCTGSNTVLYTVVWHKYLAVAYLTIPFCTIGTKRHCRMAVYSSMRFQYNVQHAAEFAQKEIKYNIPA